MSEEWNENMNMNREEGGDSSSASNEAPVSETPVSEAAVSETAASEAPGENQSGTTYSWVNPKLQNNENANAQTENTQAGSWQDSYQHSNYQQDAYQQSGYRQNMYQQDGYQNSSYQQNAYQQSGQNEYQNDQNRYSYYQTSAQDYRSQDAPFDKAAAKAEKKRMKKEKKAKQAKQPRHPAGPGRKWLVTVCMALVFGLIAGGVFCAVAAIGVKSMNGDNKGQGISETKVEASQFQDSQNAASGDDENGASTVSTDNSSTVTEVVNNVMPSVVTITCTSVQEMQSFFGGTQEYEVKGAGTGVIVGENETELLIATNYHVVMDASSLAVGFVDEQAVEAAVKGTDSENDLAVVAVKLEDIPEETRSAIRIATIGSSDDLQLGEDIIAIGNALGYGQSVTTGCVSAFDRSLDLTYTNGESFTSSNLIQVDAPINSGNSGGGLFNMKGELVGINEAKESVSSSGTVVDGMGFAIPISKAEPILEELMNRETRTVVDESDACYLGVTCADVTDETAQMYNMPVGVCFTSVVEDSPAEAAGLKKGDILTSFDGNKITSYESLQEVLQYYAAGETVDIVVQRADNGEYEENTVTITLGSMDDMPEEYKTSTQSQNSDQGYYSQQGNQMP